jgi:DNA mismatch endonuclease (patch repair protein)
VDRLTPTQRSENMRRIKSKNSTPELRVRSLVHRMGYRYRLHNQSLPGRPDLVFAQRKKIIFLHGCFWHAHQCRIAHTPGSRQEYWTSKLQRNAARDREHQQRLTALGWQVLVIWECELTDMQALMERVRKFLGKARRSG